MKLKGKAQPIKGLAILPLVLAMGSAGLSAETKSDYPRYISFVSENDNYVPPRDDRHYTSGFRLSYGFQKGRRSTWRDWLGALSNLARDTDAQEYDFSIGQNIYTPTVFTIPQAILNDRPYAAWLYGELSVRTVLRQSEEVIALNLGVVGPAALGEEAQKFIHSISGDPEPRGWSNQLDNEPALLIHYRRSWFKPLYQSQSYGIDLVPRFAFNLGNVVTEIGVGSSIRAGSHLPQRDIPARMQPGLATSSPRFEARKGRMDWLLFGGLLGRAVGHNIFLDGNTWQDSLSVDKKKLAWDANLGLMLTFGQFSRPFAISFTHVWRSKEFEVQRDIDKYGSIQISVQF